ncbi:MAG: 30S ribosomal protein S9 [Deltaproteobacteria bacterium]|nr:30S ribosomal protein S9 [Deltaproteobacteria bacterium]MBW2340215.1 30S ribosomal protein S9 [Deltaproteobacteria bacterium]
MAEERYYATGKRKRAIARVWMKLGEGKIVINRKPIDEYLTTDIAKMIVAQPLELTNTTGRYDIMVNVNGGGYSGQVGAIRHGISRALLKISPEFREPLKKEGFLTRDSRIKERKKYGLRSARARFQYSKR